MSMTRKKALSLLGLSELATPKDIRSAYLSKSMATHPDKHLEEKEKYGELFNNVKEAHTFLTQTPSSPEPESKSKPENLYAGEYCVHLFVTRWRTSHTCKEFHLRLEGFENVVAPQKNAEYEEKMKEAKKSTAFGHPTTLCDKDNKPIGYQDYEHGYHIYFRHFQDAVNYLANPHNIRHQHDIGAYDNFPIVLLVDKNAGTIIDIFSGACDFQHSANLYHLPPVDQRKLDRGDALKTLISEDYSILEFTEGSTQNTFINLVYDIQKLLRNQSLNIENKHQELKVRLLQEEKLSPQELDAINDIVQYEILLSLPEYLACEKSTASLKKDAEGVKKSTALNELLTLLRKDKQSCALFLKMDLAAAVKIQQVESKSSVGFFTAPIEAERLQQLNKLIQQIASVRKVHTVLTFLNASSAEQTNQFKLLKALQNSVCKFSENLMIELPMLPTRSIRTIR
jgi:hypothetical protein